MALIVVMEDDAGTRMLIASVLRKDGHEVLTAENGEQGLGLVKTKRPDLVISDVQMPLLNGFQMLSAVRQDASIAATPVILLTSLQERAHMRIGMNTGADDYITKPFRPAELREAAAAQLNKRVMQATLQGMAVDAAVQAALQKQKDQLARLYEQRLAAELSERWPSGDGAEDDEKFSAPPCCSSTSPAMAVWRKSSMPTNSPSWSRSSTAAPTTPCCFLVPGTSSSWARACWRSLPIRPTPAP